MTKIIFNTFGISLIFLLLACNSSANAQQTPTAIASTSPETVPVNTIPFRNTTLANGQRPNSPIDVRVFGSVSGRVFNDAGANREKQAADRPGVGGVKVILRSANAGLADIVADQISDARGKYDFLNLSPGKYTIELDPISIPDKFRISDITVSAFNVGSSRSSEVDVPVTAKRTITGTVFIDNDGDGQFTVGKDEPVEGAMITVNGIVAISNAKGRYILRDLPAGRISLLVRWPNIEENTQVVLYLYSGPVTNRLVNVSRKP